MDDPSEVVQALLGLGSCVAAVPINVDSEEDDGANAKNAKRKYDDSFTAVTPSICQICTKQYIPKGDFISSPFLFSCDKCLKRVSIITNLSFSHRQVSVERRRHSPVQELYTGLHGMDVAEAAMACMGSFLSPVEKAVFGVALDPTGTGQPTLASEMVMGKKVDALDFGEIDQGFASRMTDDLLRCILVNVNAKNNLKVLKLTHCTGITGAGIEPISGSTTLQIIDLSLVKLHQASKVESESLLSEAAVLPILDSILQHGSRSALKHIQFHKNWSNGSSRWFDDFMSKYNDFISLAPKQLCSFCDKLAPEGFTCYLCLDYVCDECLSASSKADPETHHKCGSYCMTSEKNFCHRCVEFKQCEGDECLLGQRDNCSGCVATCKTCKKNQCPSCTFGGTCHKCGNDFCGNFGSNCLGERCHGCNKTFCDKCVAFEFCGCDAPFCADCKVDECNHEW